MKNIQINVNYYKVVLWFESDPKEKNSRKSNETKTEPNSIFILMLNKFVNNVQYNACCMFSTVKANTDFADTKKNLYQNRDHQLKCTTIILFWFHYVHILDEWYKHSFTFSTCIRVSTIICIRCYFNVITESYFLYKIWI